MLAAAGEYFQPWQLPLFAVFLFAWLVGGGYLVQVIIGPRTEQRKYTLGRGILVSFLSGAGGGFAALALYKIGSAIFPIEPDPLKLPICWPGFIAGIIGFLVVAFLIVFAMHKMPLGKTISASIIPIGAPLLLGAVLAGVSIHFSAKIVQAERRHMMRVNETIMVLSKLYKALEDTTLRTGRPPATLEELVEKSPLEDEDIQSPVNPKGRGFFFNGGRTTTDRDSRRILLCDYVENFPGKGRAVLYEGGSIEFLPTDSFQTRLNQTENRAFAKALQEAEGKK